MFFGPPRLAPYLKGGRTQKEESHEGRKDRMGGRTQRERGHKGREDTKGGRTQREDGHKGREEGERHHGLHQERRGNCQVSREEQALPH